MRFVADPLHDTQRRRVRTGHERRGIAMYEQSLLTGLAIRPFRDTDEFLRAESQLFELRVHLVDLPETTVDQQHIGRDHFTAADAFVAASQRLAQRAVIVSRGHPGDVEAAVVLFHRTFGSIHHAGSDRTLARRVADVETLQALRRLFEA